MKKLISLLLSLVLSIGCALSLTSCSATPPEVPEGYVLYENDDLSFAYPEGWVSQKGSITILASSLSGGNNITLAYEEKTDAYEDLTVESFNTLLKPSLESIGMSISGIVITEEKTNNVELTKITYDATVGNMKVYQTLFITTVGENTYTITITELNKDSKLVDTVFKTLYSKESVIKSILDKYI